ncbi:MAG: ribose-phosphate pyrophosphokinase [Alphaproteobacteria bacterium]|nr:ribose-phosphate pyrophosphokinase [Rickettsiales bacterium]
MDNEGKISVFEDKKYVSLNYNGLIPTQFCKLNYKTNNFSCGEVGFVIKDNCVNQCVVIFQSFSVGKFNDDLLNLILLCNALWQSKVLRIELVAPFLPYTRQDSYYCVSGKGVASLGVQTVADVINMCKISKITTFDLHSQLILKFLKGDLTQLSAIPLFIQNIKKKFNPTNVCIVFPDISAARRIVYGQEVVKIIKDEGFNVATMCKQRINIGGSVKITLNSNQIIGKKVAIIIDDMIDSGQTVIHASNILLANGVKEVYCYATHGVFLNSSVKKLKNSSIKTVFISNSIKNNYPNKPLLSKFNVIELDKAMFTMW